VKKRFGNTYTGDLPEGCRLCMEGAKLVLFVTGVCGKACFYCPLSEKRAGRDLPWANERPVHSTDDIIYEAERMDALGAGITGGDPAVRMERTLEYIRLLKKNFGTDFHIHMYTAMALGGEDLKDLKGAGLDEIRYHAWGETEDMWRSMEKAMETGLSTGVEIPAVPGEEEEIVAIARRLDEMGAEFLNLNELEFSHENARAMKEKGYELKSETSYAVRGSEEAAMKAMAACRDLELAIHFCTSSYKDSHQLKERLLRTATNTAKVYEDVTEEGLLLKGVIRPAGGDGLESLKRTLQKKFDIPGELLFIDTEKKRIETSIDVAERLSEMYKGKGVEFFLVEEYPTYDRLETQVITL